MQEANERGQKIRTVISFAYAVNESKKNLLDNYIHELKKIKTKKNTRILKLKNKKQIWSVLLKCVVWPYQCLSSDPEHVFAWKPPGCLLLKCFVPHCVSRVHNLNFFLINLHQKIASHLRLLQPYGLAIQTQTRSSVSQSFLKHK